MKPSVLSVVLVTLMLLLWVPVSAEKKGKHRDTLYQVSTLDALLEGDYDGKTDFRQLEKHGDFGLGTFASLDGEMVAIDGVFYQVQDDGVARQVNKDQQTPFAAVTFFKADDTFRITEPTPCSDLMEILLDNFPSDQMLYAIKLTGLFHELTTRSVPAQSKPYVPLAEALEEQVIFEFDRIDATLVGFWLPNVLADVNAAGFHFHAITADHLAGGHVLDCEVSDVEIEIDYMHELRVQFEKD